MNSFKPLYFSAFALLVLASCGTSKQVTNSSLTAISAPLNIAKKAPIAEKDLKRWSHLDIVTDTIPGMSVDKAYAELLKNKKGKKVIVAILDSGVDIEHPDLKPVIWTNKKKSPTTELTMTKMVMSMIFTAGIFWETFPKKIMNLTEFSATKTW